MIAIGFTLAIFGAFWLADLVAQVTAPTEPAADDVLFSAFFGFVSVLLLALVLMKGLMDAIKSRCSHQDKQDAAEEATSRTV